MFHLHKYKEPILHAEYAHSQIHTDKVAARAEDETCTTRKVSRLMHGTSSNTEDALIFIRADATQLSLRLAILSSIA